jgi:hypothetical protein
MASTAGLIKVVSAVVFTLAINFSRGTIASFTPIGLG